MVAGALLSDAQFPPQVLLATDDVPAYAGQHFGAVLLLDVEVGY